jgi:hypothetical protein
VILGMRVMGLRRDGGKVGSLGLIVGRFYFVVRMVGLLVRGRRGF